MATRMVPTCSVAGCHATASHSTGRCPAHPKAVPDVRKRRPNGWSMSRMRGLVLRRDDWTCARCGHRDVTGTTIHADHVTRHADGGASDDPLNYQTLCTPCHRDKTRAEAQAAPRGGGGPEPRRPQGTSGIAGAVASK